MLFYSFFKTLINKEVVVELKNDVMPPPPRGLEEELSLRDLIFFFWRFLLLIYILFLIF